MLVHLAAFCCVSMWGLSFVSSKVLLEEGLGTVEIYIYRFTIAYVLMLLISHSRIMAQSARDEGMFALCGICAGSIYFIAENTALQYTLTTNVSLLTSISPLVTALLAGFIYPNERPGKGLLTGSMVAFLGVAMVIFNASATLEIRPLGDLLALGACFSWAVYSLILRRLSANYDVFSSPARHSYTASFPRCPSCCSSRSSTTPSPRCAIPACCGTSSSSPSAPPSSPMCCGRWP